MWDSIERGRCDWHDQSYISYTSGPATSAAASAPKKSNTSQPDPVYMVCRDFNSASGCKHGSSHDNGAVSHMHVCAYCDAVGRKSAHSVIKCRARGENAGGQHHESRQWSSQHNKNSYGGGHQSGYQQQGQSYLPQTYYNNYSKNGQ